MDRKKIVGAIGACSLVLISQGAFAALLYNQNVTSNVIFGSGNANGAFTVDRQNNVELGLRGKLRHNAAGAPENTFNSNGDGTYSFAAGSAPTQSPSTAVWSFEWSINSDQSGTGGRNLSALTYMLGIDSDAGIGTNYATFDPIATGGDHAFGNNSTANGAGTEATDAASYAALISNNNLAQNSWKAHWYVSPFDPTVDGQYEFYLAAYNLNGEEVARTSMSIIVGNGAVPVPSTIALMGLVLAGLGWSRRKQA